MTMSVGFGRIVNDPEATILTRQALGRLQTPGLLVNDQGLTIDTNGRMVLRISSGLSEDTSGLSVKVKSGGGIVSGDDGLALDDPLGDITFTNITVNQNANITGDVNVAGGVNVIGAVTTPAINSGTITNTGDITSGTATIVGNASVGGTFTGVVINAGTLAVSGNASVTGTLTAGNLAVTGNAGIAGSMGCGSASVGGALTAASASISGNISSVSATVSGSATINSILCTTGSFTNFGCVTSNTTGNATIGGNLTVTGTITGGGGGGGSGAITPASVRINGGTTILRCLSFFVTLTIGLGGGSPNIYQEFTAGLPGAFAGDSVIISPISTPGLQVAGWSACIPFDGSCSIRISKTDILGTTHTITFRVTVIGFL